MHRESAHPGQGQRGMTSSHQPNCTETVTVLMIIEIEDETMEF